MMLLFVVYIDHAVVAVVVVITVAVGCCMKIQDCCCCCLLLLSDLVVLLKILVLFEFSFELKYFLLNFWIFLLFKNISCLNFVVGFCFHSHFKKETIQFGCQLSPPSWGSSPSPWVSDVHRVRLSLNNCMISVESLYESSLRVSSSAIASSKAYTQTQNIF